MNKYVNEIHKLLNNQFLISIFLVVSLCIIGLALPVFPYLLLDTDSSYFITHDFNEVVNHSYQRWGIYRIAGFFLVKCVYSIPFIEKLWLPIEILSAFAAKFIFVLAAIRILKLDTRFLPLLFAAAVGQIFWTGTALMLARSLNDLLAAVVGAAFLYFASSDQCRGVWMGLLVVAYGLMCLVTYESYCFYSVAIILATRPSQWKSIMVGGIIASVCIFFLQIEGTFLHSPKLIASYSAQAFVGTRAVDGYLMNKVDQMAVTVAAVTIQSVTLSLFAANAMFFVLMRSFSIAKPDQSAKNQKNGLLGAVILIVGCVAPLALAVATLPSIGPNGSRINWILISGSLWLFIFALVFVAQYKPRVIFGLVTIVSFIFGISVLLMLQLSKAIDEGDNAYLQRSLFASYAVMGHLGNRNGVHISYDRESVDGPNVELK